ncbi:acyltransferase family protein [Fuscovulum blasticum]|uniref:acyltransferase family protein n=1 Tax=Fuscovulum blasticum TaxID=1075 RepID=UPI000D3E5C4D|nr:acyltransferase [Fuscovulum blasticum]AWD23665.1 hypothetical protein B6K69_17685 [Fuscovulum blasticum]
MTPVASKAQKPILPDNFAAIRLLAALTVVFGHSFPLTGGEGPGYLGSTASTLAVKIFFVISGYMISESWRRDPHLGRYLRRRALRIFPALFFLCLITVLLVGPALTKVDLATYFSHHGTWNYFTNIALYPNYSLPGVFDGNIYPGAVNGSLWTLPIEFSMYLMLPALLIIPFQRVTVCVMAIGLSIASIWYTRISIPSEPIVLYGSNVINGLEMTPYFLWGMVYRLWFRSEWLSLQISVMAIMLLPLATSTWAGAELVSLILVPYVTLSFGHAHNARFSWVEKLGDMSYGTYLYGFLVQQIIAQMIGTPGAHWTNFIASVPPTLILGFLSWHLVEKPAMALKPRKGSHDTFRSV